MTQPIDEETTEHPAYGAPPEPLVTAEPEPVPNAEPVADADLVPGAEPMTDAEPPAAADPAAAWQAPPEPQTQPWQQPPPAPPPVVAPPPGPAAAPPPPQQWQQPAQTWQQPPPAQWQAPPPGYGAPPPGYGAAPQQWTGPLYSTSALVALAGLVLVVFGLFVAVAGAWSLTQGPEIGRFIRDNDIAVFGRQLDRETLRAALTPMPGVLMVVGVLQLLVGATIFAHKGWARALGVLLSVLGVLVGVFAVSTAVALAPGLSVPMLVALVLLLGYAYALLALIAGGGHFRARHGR